MADDIRTVVTWVWNCEILIPEDPPDTFSVTKLSRSLWRVSAPLTVTLDWLLETQEHILEWFDLQNRPSSNLPECPWLPALVIPADITVDKQFNSLLELFVADRQSCAGIRIVWSFVFDLQYIFASPSRRQIRYIVRFVYHIFAENVLSRDLNVELTVEFVRKWLAWFRTIEDSVLYAGISHIFIGALREGGVCVDTVVDDWPSPVLSRTLRESLGAVEIRRLLDRYGQLGEPAPPRFAFLPGPLTSSRRAPGLVQWQPAPARGLPPMSSVMQSAIKKYIRDPPAVGCLRLAGFGAASLKEAFEKVDRAELERWNAFQRYELPQPFEAFGMEAAKENRLLKDLMEVGIEDEAPMAAYKRIFASPVACYLTAFTPGETVKAGLGRFIIRVVSTKREITLGRIVDEVMKWRPEDSVPRDESKRHAKLAVRTALEELVRSDFGRDEQESYLSTHHFLLMLLVRQWREENGFAAEITWDDLIDLPVAIVKHSIRLVGRLRAQKITLEDCGEFTPFINAFLNHS
jgi:hypothetical protein